LAKIAASELDAEGDYPQILGVNRDQLDSPEALAAGMVLQDPYSQAGVVTSAVALRV